MRVTFRFHSDLCQTRLRHAITAAGKQETCPKCNGAIEVPLPPVDAIMIFLRDVPVPVPNEPLSQYLNLHKSVVAFANLAMFARERCDLPVDFFYRCVDDVVRSLRSIHAFAVQAIEKEDGVDARRGALPGVRQVAAGTDFAGDGRAKRTNKRFERWGDSLPPKQFSMPSSSDLDLIQESIKRYDQVKRSIKRH